MPRAELPDAFKTEFFIINVARVAQVVSKEEHRVARLKLQQKFLVASRRKKARRQDITNCGRAPMDSLCAAQRRERMGT